MKKSVSLVLILALALTAVYALAEGSKEEPTSGGTPATPAKGEPVITMSFIEDTSISKAVIEAFKAAYDQGDILAALPEEVKAQVPEGFGKMNEMLTAQFVGDVGAVTKDYKMEIAFETKYTEGAKVLVLLGILPEGVEGDVEFSSYEGKGLANGNVEITIPVEVFQKVQNNPFIVGVISE